MAERQAESQRFRQERLPLPDG